MEASIAQRGPALGRLVLMFLLTAFVSTLLLTASPTPALAQEEPAPAAEEKKDEEPKSKMSANPIVHFFVSIGVVFGIIFAALSVGTLALIIILVMDLRMSEAVSTAFVDEFTGLVNKQNGFFDQANTGKSTGPSPTPMSPALMPAVGGGYTGPRR